MIQINKEKCTGCGLCVRDCTGNIIKVGAGNIQDCPENILILENGKAAAVTECILCGHCAAVCPEKAISIPGYDMEDVEEFAESKFSLKPERVLRAIKFRRSTRDFQKKKIEREKMERILQAGRYTETAVNRQACTFVFVQDGLKELKKLFWQELPGTLEQFRKNESPLTQRFEMFYEMWKKDPTEDRFFFNTPAILVTATEFPLDGGLASANIETMAVAEDLGILFSGYLVRTISDSKVIREWLGINGKSIVSCMLIGYPAVSYKRTAPRKKADILWK